MPVNLPTHKISKNLLRIVEAVETLENSVLMKKILSANIADKLNVIERSSKVWDGTQITLAASYDSSPSQPELTTIGRDNKTTLKKMVDNLMEPIQNISVEFFTINNIKADIPILPSATAPPQVISGQQQEMLVSKGGSYIISPIHLTKMISVEVTDTPKNASRVNISKMPLDTNRADSTTFDVSTIRQDITKSLFTTNEHDEDGTISNVYRKYWE